MEDDLEGFLEQLLADAQSNDGQLKVFEQAFQTSVRFPLPARAVGVSVQVTSIVYEGDARSGLVAICWREDEQHRVSVADVVPGPVTVDSAMLLAAYRRWCGMPPLAAGAPPPTSPDEVWVYRGLARAPIELPRPLALVPQGIWDPTEEYWGEAGEDVHPLVRQRIDAGRRPAFEMEQLLPGVADDDWDVDPVADAAELHRGGGPGGKSDPKDLIAQDDRCMDAWVHLGNIAFDKRGPAAAWELYDRAVAIGEETIGSGFVGVLPRAFADNRPFHRALHGLGLCGWRQRRWQDAQNIFTSRLWLDGTGAWDALSCLDQVVAHRRWTKE